MPPNLGKPYLSPKRTSVGKHGWLNGPIHVTVPRSNNHAIWASITLPSSLAVQTNKPQLSATPVTGASVIQPPPHRTVIIELRSIRKVRSLEAINLLFPRKGGKSPRKTPPPSLAYQSSKHPALNERPKPKTAEEIKYKYSTPGKGILDLLDRVRNMSSKNFQHSFSSGERVQDQRKPEHLFPFALPRGLTGLWAQLNKAHIQIFHLKKRLKKARKRK